MLKKISLVTMLLVMGMVLMGCSPKEKNLEGSLPDIMAKIYEKTGTEKPKMLENVEVTKDNLKGYLGLDTLDFKEAIASEPMIGSIAHSVVLVRVNKDVDIEKTKSLIKTSVNPRKWVCVGVEEKDVIVESRGDIIILIMVNEDSAKFAQSFKSL